MRCWGRGGGADDDFLDGGTQNDTLLDGDGSDLLFAGKGSDYLDGNGGTDHLSSSNLAFFDPRQYVLDSSAYLHEDHVSAVVAAWTSPGTYEQRIAATREAMIPTGAAEADGVQDTFVADEPGQDWYAADSELDVFAVQVNELFDELDGWRRMPLALPACGRVEPKRGGAGASYLYSNAEQHNSLPLPVAELRPSPRRVSSKVSALGLARAFRSEWNRTNLSVRS